MKKYILLIAIMIVSCDTPVEETQGFGFWAGDENETFVAGPTETTELYNQFIDAHNNQDVEAVGALLSDDIVIYYSDGNVVEDKATHLEGLQSWFEETNPSFNPFWGMPYVGVDNGETWMIAGHQTVATVDGVEVSAGTMLDIQFTDGLVSTIIIYSRATQPSE